MIPKFGASIQLNVSIFVRLQYLKSKYFKFEKLICTIFYKRVWCLNFTGIFFCHFVTYVKWKLKPENYSIKGNARSGINSSTSSHLHPVATSICVNSLLTLAFFTND